MYDTIGGQVGADEAPPETGVAADVSARLPSLHRSSLDTVPSQRGARTGCAHSSDHALAPPAAHLSTCPDSARPSTVLRSAARPCPAYPGRSRQRVPFCLAMSGASRSVDEKDSHSSYLAGALQPSTRRTHTPRISRWARVEGCSECPARHGRQRARSLPSSSSAWRSPPQPPPCCHPIAVPSECISDVMWWMSRRERSNEVGNEEVARKGGE